MPYYVACFINMVRSLIHYGTHLDEQMPRLVNHPRYPTLAAGWGTHDPSRILLHIERGLMRARVLLRYLQAMAKAGLEIEPKPREIHATSAAPKATSDERSNPKASRAKPSRPLPGLTQRLPPCDPDHPLHFERLSTRQLWADMYRLGPVANFILSVQDLGGHFGLFGQKFHHNMIAALTLFPGGDIVAFNKKHNKRVSAFMEERERRPDTWTHHLWDRTKEVLREMIGFLLGEDPAEVAGAVSSKS